MTGHTHAFDAHHVTVTAEHGVVMRSQCTCGLVKEEFEGRTSLRWPGQDWLRIDPAMLRVVCAPPVSLVNVEAV